MARILLSEHTTEIEEEPTRTFDCPPKPSLTTEEINQCLFEAMKKNVTVAIQREEVNEEGGYPQILSEKSADTTHWAFI